MRRAGVEFLADPLEEIWNTQKIATVIPEGKVIRQEILQSMLKKIETEVAASNDE